jgi:hypothetical protein
MVIAGNTGYDDFIFETPYCAELCYPAAALIEEHQMVSFVVNHRRIRVKIAVWNEHDECVNTVLNTSYIKSGST